MSLQVDTDILLQLIEQLRRLGGAQDVSEAITAAIAFWLDQGTEDPPVRPVAEPAYPRGYQWKSLFLPEGTILRSWSYGEHNYACVEGDRIIHQGRAVSPNQFAQSFARSTRNAWSDLFVRRPGDKQFKLARHLRRELAEQETKAAQVTIAAPPSDGVSAMLAALLTHARAVATPTTPTTPAVEPSAAEPPPAVEPPPAPCRDSTPAPRWDLPERRQFRYRIEDVAFD
ncbi:hypothetical protein [Rugamonas sp.]|uniref:hypothetical protein n=1 Tax=Rugamonas sp. TaxID=1926287 RepID=UPI0025F9C9AB|nr:hypothetical protein [Rugamonas sp.]